MSSFKNKIILNIFTKIILCCPLYLLSAQPDLSFDLHVDSSVFFKKTNYDSDFEFTRKTLYLPLMKMNLRGQLLDYPVNYECSFSNEDPTKTRFIFENQKDAFIDRENLSLTKAYISFGQTWNNSIGLVPLTQASSFHQDFNPHIQNGHPQEVIGAIIPKSGPYLGWRLQSCLASWFNIDFSIWQPSVSSSEFDDIEFIRESYDLRGRELSDFDTFEKIKDHIEWVSDEEDEGAAAVRFAITLYDRDHLSIGGGLSISNQPLNKKYVFNILDNVGNQFEAPRMNLIYNERFRTQELDFVIVSGPIYLQSSSSMVQIGSFLSPYGHAHSAAKEFGVLIGDGAYIYSCPKANVVDRQASWTKPLYEIIFRHGKEYYDQQMALLNKADWNFLESGLVTYDNRSGIEYYLINNTNLDDLRNNSYRNRSFNSYYFIEREGYSFAFNTYLNKSFVIKTEYSVITQYLSKNYLNFQYIQHSSSLKTHQRISSFKTRLEMSF